MTETAAVELSEVSVLVSSQGYQVEELSDNLILITNPETNLKIVGALNGEVLVFSCKLFTYQGTVADFVAKNAAAVADILTGAGELNAKTVLAEDEGVTNVNLTASVKLLALGEDDADDISYALSSLEQDAMFDSRDVFVNLQ